MSDELSRHRIRRAFDHLREVTQGLGVDLTDTTGDRAAGRAKKVHQVWQEMLDAGMAQPGDTKTYALVSLAFLAGADYGRTEGGEG